MSMAYIYKKRSLFDNMEKTKNSPKLKVFEII